MINLCLKNLAFLVSRLISGAYELGLEKKILKWTEMGCWDVFDLISCPSFGINAGPLDPLVMVPLPINSACMMRDPTRASDRRSREDHQGLSLVSIAALLIGWDNASMLMASLWPLWSGQNQFINTKFTRPNIKSTGPTPGFWPLIPIPDTSSKVAWVKDAPVAGLRICLTEKRPSQPNLCNALSWKCEAIQSFPLSNQGRENVN